MIVSKKQYILGILLSITLPTVAMKKGFLLGKRLDTQEDKPPKQKDNAQNVFTMHHINDPLPSLKDGKRALHLCACLGATELMLSYINQGAEINIQDNNQDTPLITAIMHQQVKAAQLLLEHGANPNSENRFKLRPLDFANARHNQQLIELLKKHGAQESSNKGNQSTAKEVLEKVLQLPENLQKEFKQLMKNIHDTHQIDNEKKLFIFCKKHGIPTKEDITSIS